ncbi:MAG: VOC family protein [Steroidobacteraceae bacterium]|jgi:predicted lactoylglutathione lyase|nr:VOC family protein [Steroidobacteraceae bacterium]
MIGYVTLGTNDLERAKGFYDALLAELGGKVWMSTERFCGWTQGNGPAVAVITPHDGNAATVGNGTMVALAAGSREQVDRVWRKALELGGKDEGAAGERFQGFYAGYFRDLDGNKLAVFHMG